jgi:hypothetical protein
MNYLCMSLFLDQLFSTRPWYWGYSDVWNIQELNLYKNSAWLSMLKKKNIFISMVDIFPQFCTIVHMYI